MKTGAPHLLLRSLSLAVAGILMAMLAACTGRGGGQLPADNLLGFSGTASFGFSFSCQNGDLRIQLDYTDRGGNLLGSQFSIHGIVDQVDPVLESAVCIGENPPPVPNELIFLGRYYLTSSPPAGFPSQCSKSQDETPLCRFEVTVRDNDRNLAPSTGDSFSITLSNVTDLYTTECPGGEPPCLITDFDESDPTTVFYTRAGVLDSGNITVD
jgi:hypothetical protein